MRRGLVFCGVVMLALAHASTAAALVPAVADVWTTCIPSSPNHPGWCTVQYEGLAGDEQLRVSQPSASTVVLADSGGGVMLTDDPSCSGSGTSTVVCTPPEPEVSASVAAGPGNDVVEIGHRSADVLGGVVVYGEQGQDTLLGSPHPDTLLGGPGDDRLSGRAGDDNLTGGSGADSLDGGNGNDILFSIDDNGLQRIDQVDCGPGGDTAVWETLDVVSGCEYTF